MRPSAAYNGNLASEGNDNKSRGSKQKIIQLKDELNGGGLQINPKFEKMKVLRESYEIAKFRANELLQPHDQNLYVKAHGLRASKIYSALSTLIFVSISCSKVEELEDYVMQSAAQVPSSIFDLEEWSSIVKIAKDCREGDSNSLREQIATLKENLKVYYQLSANPLKAAQMELKLLRSEVSNELGGAQRDLAGSINLIMQLANELQNGTGSKQVQKLNKLLHDTDVMERKAEAARAEELEALRETHNAALAQIMNMENQQSELTEELHTITDKLESSELQNAQLANQTLELAKEMEALKAAAAVSPRRITAEQQAQQVRDFQELYEQYHSLTVALEQRDQQINILQEKLKGGSIKLRIDGIEQDEPEVTVPQPTPQAQIVLENQVSALTDHVTELEQELEQERKRIKVLSTEVRLNEAARCEAVDFAEAGAAQLSAARDDIEALQHEVDALREAMHQRNLEAVCATIAPSPRSSFITPSLTKFLPSFRMGTSFRSIKEEGESDDVAITVADDDEESQKIDKSSDVVAVGETECENTTQAVEASHAEEDKALIAAEAAHTAASAVFLGAVHVAVMQDEFSHNPPYAAAPAIEPEAEPEPEAVTDITAEKESERDSHLIADEAARIAHSAVFLGAVHVAVMQDEFSHNPPSVAAPAMEPESVAVAVADSTAEKESERDSHLIADEAARIAHSAVFLGAVHVAVMQDEFSHNPPHPVEETGESTTEAEAGVAGTKSTEPERIVSNEVEPSNAPVAEEAEVPVVEMAAEVSVAIVEDETPDQEADQATPATPSQPVRHVYSPEDAHIVTEEASRLANTAMFLGTVHVAVMQDEFMSRIRLSPSIPVVEGSLQPEPAEEHFSDESAATKSDVVAEKEIISAAASRVVATAVFGGAVRVAVQQHEFHHRAKPVQCTEEQSSAEQSTAVLPASRKEAPEIVQPEANVASDGAIIAAEAAHAAASAVFLGTVHVAVMKDEFSHNPPHMLTPAIKPEAGSEPEPEPVAADSTPDKEWEQDSHLIADEAARIAHSAVFLGAVHVAVMQDEFSHNPPHAVSPTILAGNDHEEGTGAKEEVSVTDTGASTVGGEIKETVEAENDKLLISKEAAHAVASAVFLGTVHVAVMQEEFAHHPPRANTAAEVGLEPLFAPTDLPPSARNLSAEPEDEHISSAAEQDKALIAAEAAHNAASAVFLGAVHVAVMKDEFSHNPTHAIAKVEEPVTDITAEKESEQDSHIIADEAARISHSAVFLGAVHVAVMQDEFSHNPPHATAPAMEPKPESVAVTDITAEKESEQDIQLIADEAARIAHSAVFLGAVHVAVMQDEFSHNPPHVVAPAIEPEAEPAAAAAGVTAGEPPVVDIIVKEVATTAESTAQADTSVNASMKVAPAEGAVTEPVPPASREDSTTPSPTDLVDATELTDNIESEQAPAVRKPSIDEFVIVPIRNRGRSSSGSKSVKFSQILTAVEIFETEPVNNSELWTPDPTQKTFSFEEEALSTSESQRAEAEVAGSVSDRSSVSEKTAAAPQERMDPAAGSAEELKSEKLKSEESPDTVSVFGEIGAPEEPPSAEDTVVTEAPAVPWTIEATKGTEQGKHGWYSVNGQLCYYGSDKGEPLLLCGAVTEEVYNMALAAESAAQNATTSSSLSNHTVEVDRLGVRATRLQAECLREEMLNLEHKHTQAVQELDAARALTEAELFDCQALVHTLHEEIAQCKEIITHLEGDRRRNQLTHQQTERFNKKASTLSIEQVVALVKLTSIVRGFLGRARVRRLQVSKLARESGILHAMANTKQGEAGWYMGPKGNIFYFAIKNGAWTTVAGPLTHEEFELMMLARKQKQVRNSQEVLTMCRVPLQPDWEGLTDGGELYVANVSDKVFVCRPLDAMIASAYPAPVTVERDVDPSDVPASERLKEGQAPVKKEKKEKQAKKSKKAEAALTQEENSQKMSLKSALKGEADSEQSDSGRDSPVPKSPSRITKGSVSFKRNNTAYELSDSDRDSPVPLSPSVNVKGPVSFKRNNTANEQNGSDRDSPVPVLLSMSAKGPVSFKRNNTAVEAVDFNNPVAVESQQDIFPQASVDDAEFSTKMSLQDPSVKVSCPSVKMVGSPGAAGTETEEDAAKGWRWL